MTRLLAASILSLATVSVWAAEPPKQTFTNSTGMVMVWVPAGFWAGKYEVTQTEYEKVVGNNPSKYKAARNPVERVNWHDAMAFCEKLTAIESREKSVPSGFTYTLPTDRQWETMLADTKLEDGVFARFGSDRKPLGPREVGSKPANSLGLHDMYGNIWEWCLELFMPNNQWRVLRGGGWSISSPTETSMKGRLNVEPETAYDFYGFRCVLVTTN